MSTAPTRALTNQERGAVRNDLEDSTSLFAAQLEGLAETVLYAPVTAPLLEARLGHPLALSEEEALGKWVYDLMEAAIEGCEEAEEEDE